MRKVMRSIVAGLCCICSHGCFYNPTDAEALDTGGASSTGDGDSTGDGESTGDGGVEPPHTEFQGIYEIGSWTRNPEGCDADGSSVLDGETARYFYVKPVVDEGEAFVFVSFCDTLAECQNAAASELVDFSYVLPDGSDEEGWEGSEFFFTGDESCAAYTQVYVLTGSGILTVRLEIQQLATLVGICDPDEAKAPSREQPCEQLEVREGYLVDTL